MKRILSVLASLGLVALMLGFTAGSALAWNPDVSQQCVDGTSVATVTLHADAKHSQYRLEGGAWTDYENGDKITVDGSATLDQRQRNSNDDEWSKITTEIVAIPCSTPTPPTLPTFQTTDCAKIDGSGSITVAGVTEGWQFILEPGDMLLTDGTTPLAPGTYTYGLRFKGAD